MESVFIKNHSVIKASVMKKFSKNRIIKWTNNEKIETQISFLSLEPLSIRIQGDPYSIVMRTPGDEIAHVAGFCLGEGIVNNPDDIVSIGFCDNDTNVITVTLSNKRKDEIPLILDRRGYISQTSCGICGKELIRDLKHEIVPIKNSVEIKIEDALDCLENLSDHQPLRSETRASHGAALYTPDCRLLAIAEDAGRHNALDKVIGKLFLEKKLDRVGFLVLSSRISYELIQKASRARIPIILAISRPTDLAYNLGKNLNMTLAGLSKNSGLFIYCGEERLK